MAALLLERREMDRDDNGVTRRNTTTVADATFAITSDAGQLEKKAILLCKSIRKQYPESEIINFIPESSIDDITDTSKRYFDEHTTILTDNIPIPEYDISAKLQSFAEAAEMTDREYIVMLDTDSVLLSPLTLPEERAELYVKPADIGAQYWGSSESLSDWKRLYDHFDVSFPTRTVQSTIDKRMILPYWNGGVVVTTDRSLPRQLLEMTETIVESELIEVDETFFFDQLALAILSETHSVSPLWELQNYPLNSRLGCPLEVELIHYRELRNLVRIPNPHVRRELRSLGVETGSLGAGDLKEMLVRFVYAHSGRYLSLHRKQAFGEYLSQFVSSDSRDDG